MKIRTVLPVLLLPVLPAVAQTTPKASDLIGSWKETARSGPGQKADYTDTTRVAFLTGNEYTWGRPSGFSYRGTYTVANRVLDFGSRTFTILSAAPGRLQLRDPDGGVFTFTRYAKTPERTDNTAASSGQRASNAVQAVIPADFSAYLGRWEVYKRTTSTPAADRATPDNATLLRVIEVKGNAGGEQGLVYAATDAAAKPSWYVDRYKDGVFYCKGKSDRTLKVLRCAGGELVVEEGAVTYFFRKA